MPLKSMSMAILCLGLATSGLHGETDPATFQRCGFGESDGTMVGGGPDYKVRFESAGIEFTPALSANAPRNLPFGLRLETVSRGETTLISTGSARSLPHRDDGADRVEYNVGGGIIERYHVRTDGVEMSFVFPSKPSGSGDLVVRVAVETELPPSKMNREDGGITFEAPGLGGVTVGGVTGIDADGVTVTGSLDFDGTALLLSLPASFVDGATYPLVLDPLVGAAKTVASLFDEADPDAAYDLTNNLFLVVWERRFSGGDVDIRAQRTDTSGQPIGSLIFVETDSGVVAVNPSVANVNLRDRFLVAWEESLDIACRSVHANDGQVSSKVKVASGSNIVACADVGGEATTVDDDAIVTWYDFTTKSVMAAQVQLNANGTISPQVPTALVSGWNDFCPRISKSGGAVGRYLIVWQRENIVTTSIAGMVVDRNLVVKDSFVPVTLNPLKQTDPDVDGDGTHWLVVYEQEMQNGDHDIAGSHVVYHPVTGIAAPSGPEIDIESDIDDDEIDAHVAWLGESFVVTYRDEAIAPNYDAYLRSFDLLTGKPCGNDQVIAFTSKNETSIEIASQQSSATIPLSDALIVWESLDSTTLDGDILGHWYQATDGIVHDQGGGCGNGGQAYGTCAFIGNNLFTHRLEHATPNSSAWLLLAFDRIDAVCGTCTLVPSPFTGFTVGGLTTDSDGNAEMVMPIPKESGLIGLTFYDQWLIVSGSPACATLGVDLSNAIRVKIQ